jgi:hypothetical protein
LKNPSALKREYPILQNMKFSKLPIYGVIFALLDPDPESGSEKLLKVQNRVGETSVYQF